MKWAVFGELVHLNFFSWKYQMKKVSYPHYLKTSIKLSKHSLNYSLKSDPSSISKVILCANRVSSPVDTELCFLQKTALSLQNENIISQIHPTNLIQTKILLIWITNSSFCLKNCQSSPIGIKCDFRDWLWIMFEAVAKTMFA